MSPAIGFWIGVLYVASLVLTLANTTGAGPVKMSRTPTILLNLTIPAVLPVIFIFLALAKG